LAAHSPNHSNDRDAAGFLEGRPLLLNAAELANFLSISIRHVRRLNSSAKLPQPVKVGQATRWRRDEIERWVAAGCPNRASWEADFSH
jgi:predicted DNA-binding transcriptional regulator AlpA